MTGEAGCATIQVSIPTLRAGRKQMPHRLRGTLGEGLRKTDIQFQRKCKTEECTRLMKARDLIIEKLKKIEDLLRSATSNEEFKKVVRRETRKLEIEIMTLCERLSLTIDMNKTLPVMLTTNAYIQGQIYHWNYKITKFLSAYNRKVIDRYFKEEGHIDRSSAELLADKIQKITREINDSLTKTYKYLYTAFD